MREERLNTIFAKRPREGGVKTRLCPPLSPAGAAELALAMLDDTVERCLGLAGFLTSIRAGSEEDLAWFRERYPRVASVEPQRGEDLGARLAAHFEDVAREARFRTVVVVGSDAPEVPASRIAHAHEALAQGADLVLGPDQGGGYYLVGLVRPAPQLFERIPMSTRDMCARTVELARSIGLRVALLDPGFDVDEPADLERLARAGGNLRSSRRAADLIARRA